MLNSLFVTAARIVQFEEPRILLLVPLFLIFTSSLSYLLKRYDRGAVFSDLRSWVKPMRGSTRAFLLKTTSRGWMLTGLIGLSKPMLFLSVSILPLFNVGIIWVIDASLSMASEEDVFGFGGRLGGAVREITTEFAQIQNEKVRPRMGIVLFSGSTRKSLMLFDDYGRFIQHISGVTVFPSNDQGTNYEAALADALDLCTGTKDLIYCGVVMVTDGDRESETPKLFSEILPAFVEKKIRLDVIGVGQREAPLPPAGEFGSPSIFNEKDELVPITTKYDAKFLQEIAFGAGGSFYEYGERGMLQKHIRSIRQAMEDELRERTKRWVDVSEYCFMVATAIFLLHLVLLIPYNRVLSGICNRRSN